MTEEFKTIAFPTEGEYKEKGSKFLAFAWPVKNEEEVKDRLEELKKKCYNARHHCYAFILNPSGDHYRANDDGEPSHSAGDPILGQIRSLELTNTLVVVVRYFGGTKLGVGGLINAYKTVTAAALEKAEIKTVKVRVLFRLVYDYGSTNEVMRLINELDIVIEEQRFETQCFLQGAIAIGQRELLKEKIKLLQDLGKGIRVSSEQ
jgi:uncharacterized YigZ family protein